MDLLDRPELSRVLLPIFGFDVLEGDHRILAAAFAKPGEHPLTDLFVVFLAEDLLDDLVIDEPLHQFADLFVAQLPLIQTIIDEHAVYPPYATDELALHLAPVFVEDAQRLQVAS